MNPTLESCINWKGYNNKKECKREFVQSPEYCTSGTRASQPLHFATLRVPHMDWIGYGNFTIKLSRDDELCSLFVN
jgi:hypothetical protein